MECFQSTLNPEKVMSVTTWRDEEAVVQWRNVEAHLSAQRAGRDKIFRTTACASPRCCATTA